MSKTKGFGLCGKDEHGGDKRDRLLFEEAQKGWKESRDKILALLYFLLCTHIAKRVNKEGLSELGLDHDLILTAALAHLEKAMDNKKGRKNGPFTSFTDKKSTVKSCSLYVVRSTQSAIRNLRRNVGPTNQLQGPEEIAGSQSLDVEENPLIQLIELNIPSLTPRQQQVVPLIRGVIGPSDLAEDMEISATRVHELRKSAIKKLRQLVEVEGYLDE